MCHFFFQAKDFAKVWFVSFLHEVKMGEIFSLFCFVLIEDTIFKQFFFLWCTRQATGRHPTCNFLLEVEKDHAECMKRLEDQERRAPHKGTKEKPKPSLESLTWHPPNPSVRAQLRL